ncbi:MAG: toll/interleukin-1 receptor domain-containing protein [Promethearchaeota archaeon]
MIIIIVFLSYKWDDKKYADGLRGYLKNPNNKYRHIPISERNDYRNKGEVAVRTYLKGIIGECDALICLIGQNTHSSQWVAYELDVANSQGKKIIPLRIRKTSGGPPKLIKERDLKIVKWSSEEINDALS